MAIHRLQIAAAVAALLVIGGCSASPAASDGAPSDGVPSAGGFSFGFAEATLPFGGDVCQSLTEADFAAYGFTLTETAVMDGMGGAGSQCVYRLDSDARSTEVGVAYVTSSSYDAQESFANGEFTTPVDGIGDQAFMSGVEGQEALYVRIGDYAFAVSAGDGINADDQLQALGSAIADRL